LISAQVTEVPFEASERHEHGPLGEIQVLLVDLPREHSMVPGLGGREDLRDIDRILPHLLDHLPRRITDRTA
jgi:hypothetical protein